MACSNCFNGCGDITSDQCVKYTGIAIPELGINNGDTLASVENAITTKLVAILGGVGIIFDFSEDVVCTIVKNYLPPSLTDVTLNQIITALIKSTCELESYVVNLANEFNQLEDVYSVECLSSVLSTSGTHSILQATINAVCENVQNLEALAIDLSANYVAIADINNYIQTYINNSGSNLVKNKMVPHSAIEYYGPLSNFDLTGSGINDWINIYLCNGQNGTPDKRGRIGVGATTMGATAFNSAVDPGIAGNHTYSLLSSIGSNTVMLTVQQLPSHSHTATSTATSTDHSHFMANTSSAGILTTSTPIAFNYEADGSDDDYELKGGTTGVANLGKTSSNKSDVTVSTTVSPFGGGLGHSNIQPVLACYYIIYIP